MKIRIGNDFKTEWAITWLGEPEDFSDATDISLSFNIYDKKIELTKDIDYTITNNIIEIDCTPDICDIFGTYNLELHYTKPNDDFIDGERRSAVDIDAFRIVGKSEKADSTQDVSIISDAVAIFLDIAYKKLEEIEATEDVRIASEEERVVAETSREANEAIRIANEETRIASEEERVVAETSREANEAIRIANEETRITNETNRLTEEGIRIANENERDGSEVVRVQNENARDSSESVRVQNENARDSSEVVRVQNENARDSSEVVRVQNEDTRITEESARQYNEANRISEEGLRAQAESVRITEESVRQNNENVRITEESVRKNNEANRISAESLRVQAEGEREVSEGERLASEGVRVSNENTRISNEQDRQTNTTTAISNAEQATLNANNSAVYANEQGSYAEEMSSHPPTIINDYWHIWNFTTNQYESTGQYARGDSAIDGALVVQATGQSAVNTMSQKAVTDELVQLAGDVEGTIEMPIAHALNQLKEEVDSLRMLIEEGRINKLQIETLDVISEIRINGSPLIYVRDSAPSFSPDQVPQFYIDTAAGRLYTAKGTGSANDWF